MSGVVRKLSRIACPVQQPLLSSSKPSYFLRLPCHPVKRDRTTGGNGMPPPIVDIFICRRRRDFYWPSPRYIPGAAWLYDIAAAPSALWPRSYLPPFPFRFCVLFPRVLVIEGLAILGFPDWGHPFSGFLSDYIMQTDNRYLAIEIFVLQGFSSALKTGICWSISQLVCNYAVQ